MDNLRINDANIRALVNDFIVGNINSLPVNLRGINIGDWDVSVVTNMEGLFDGRSSFNQDIHKWNVSNVTNMKNMFRGCSSFNSPLNKWIVSNVTNMRGMFNGCTRFNQNLNTKTLKVKISVTKRTLDRNITYWDVSNVTDMRFMFRYCDMFNQPLKDWDVSNVTNMVGMFTRCVMFNQPLKDWNVSNVTDMAGMFTNCREFNQNIDTIQPNSMLSSIGVQRVSNQTYWDVSHVTTMKGMFAGCILFNQPLNSWNVSNVTDMEGMFENCSIFNQPLNDWTVSNVTTMDGMFLGCERFNQPLNRWIVSNVRKMKSMFENCVEYIENITSWDVSNVTTMERMFRNCYYFNCPLNDWVVNNVTTMESMFEDCEIFDRPLNRWVVNNVTNMERMFKKCKRFNQTLNGWTVSNVTTMNRMFYECKRFNQPLNSWDVSNVRDMTRMFEDCESFNQPLNNWLIMANTSTYGMFWSCRISDENKPTIPPTLQELQELERQRESALRLERLREAQIRGYLDHLPIVQNVANALFPIGQGQPEVVQGANQVVQGVGQGRGVAFEIHDAADKINYRRLIELLITPEMLMIPAIPEMPLDINFPDFINRKLTQIISSLNVNATKKRALSVQLQTILNTRLNGIDYDAALPRFQAIYYAIEYVLRQLPDFKQIYVESYLTDCFTAYIGPYPITCAKGAYERLVTSLAPACLSDPDNEAYESIYAIINKNPNKLIPLYILDWLKLHRVGTADAFPADIKPQDRRRNLVTYLLTEFPEYEELINTKIDELGLEFDETDFQYAGKKRNKGTKKCKKRNKGTKKCIKRNKGTKRCIKRNKGTKRCIKRNK